MPAMSSASPTQTAPVDDILRQRIIDAFHHPEKIATFGQSMIPDAKLQSIDHHTTDLFFSAFRTYVDHLLFSHPWCHRVYSRQPRTTPLLSSLASGITRVPMAPLYRSTLNHGLSGHYRYLNAIQHTNSARDSLESAFHGLSSVYQNLQAVHSQLTDQISMLRHIVDQTHILMQNDPQIRALSTQYPDREERLSTRVASLNARLLLSTQQIQQSQMAQDTVLRNMDLYTRLVDVFLPSYQLQMDLLSQASYHRLWWSYRQYRRSLRTFSRNAHLKG